MSRRAVVLLVGLASCVNREPGDGALAATDSAGVQITHNLVAAPDTAHVSAPVLRIGGIDVAEAYAFQDLRDVDVFAGGGIVAADAGGRVARFAANGEWLVDIGRLGEGPGEYRQPFQLQVRHDTLAVWDVGLRRLSLYDDDGSFVAVVPTRKQSLGTPLHWLGETVLDEAEWGQSADPRPAAAAIVRRSPDGAVDTLKGPYAVPEFGWEVEPQTQVGHMVMPPVFSVRPPWRVCADKLYWADPVAARLEVLAVEDGLVQVVHLARPLRQVSAADRAAYLEAVTERWNLDAQVVARMRESTEFAVSAPRITGVVCGEDGGVWVADFQPSVAEPVDAVGNAWDILDADGRQGARVVFPLGFVLERVVGGRAYGVARREMGVQVIEVYEIPGSRDAGE